MAHHGFKAMQITASALTAEALKLSLPASVFSRSTESHNQDKVSMGMIAARDCLRVLELERDGRRRAHARALPGRRSARGDAGSLRSRALRDAVRKAVPMNLADRRQDGDIAQVLALLQSGRASDGRSRSKMREKRPAPRLALLALLAAASAGAESPAIPSGPLTLEALMQRMASTTGVRAEFREEKTLALLESPLVSEGTLYFIPPSRMARITTRPGASALVIDGERMSYTDEAGASDMDLAGNRVARTIVENFVVLFAGDLAALRERYRVEFESREAALAHAADAEGGPALAVHRCRSSCAATARRSRR